MRWKGITERGIYFRVIEEASGGKSRPKGRPVHTAKSGEATRRSGRTRGEERGADLKVGQYTRHRAERRPESPAEHAAKRKAARMEGVR